MPIQRCTTGGRSGYRWGKGGKCYTGPGARKKAHRQERAIRASGWTENAQRSNSLRIDPTRTAGLRQQFIRDVNKRFTLLQRKVLALVFTDDAFGLRRKPTNPFTGNVANARFMFDSSVQQQAAFQQWLQQEVDATVFDGKLPTDPDAYWQAYAQEGYRRGTGRAFDDTKPYLKGYAEQHGQDSVRDFYNGTREEFLRSSFGNPQGIEAIKRLGARTYMDLKGATTAMATTMSRTLADGMAQGKNPLVIARELNKNIEGIGKVRARTIARTETIRAHAEGQLDALEKLGIEEVGVMVEWSTAGDNLVCPLCEDLNGMVLKINEAHAIIPRHPNCRCCWIPANVGESHGGQIRGKGDVEQAIDDSLEKELSKAAKAEGAAADDARRASRWAGADTQVAKRRPTSTIDRGRRAEQPARARKTAAKRGTSSRQAGGTATGTRTRTPRATPGGAKPLPQQTLPEPKPATTLRTPRSPAEAEQWAKDMGVQARWSHPEAATGFEYEMSQADINEAMEALARMRAKYPGVRVDKIGTFYHEDLAVWKRNFELHIEEDRRNFKGSRWRRVDAEKRVRREMVAEPTPGKDMYEQDYSIFRAGEWHKGLYGREEYGIRVNHRRVLLTDKATSDTNRLKDLARGRSLGNVGEDYSSTVEHEFGHAFQDQYGLQVKSRYGIDTKYNQKVEALFNELGPQRLENELSTYAATNPGEMMSEAFTEVQRADARPLAKQIYDLMVKEAGL